MITWLLSVGGAGISYGNSYIKVTFLLRLQPVVSRLIYSCSHSSDATKDAMNISYSTCGSYCAGQLHILVTLSFRSEWRNNFCSRRRNAVCNRRRQRWWVDANPKERRRGGLCPYVLCWSLFGQKCQRCYDLYLIILSLLYLLSQRYPSLQLCVAYRAF